MTLAAGTRLDTFEIIAPLGAGGMGEVYRARDATLKREVAIKVLPSYFSQDPDRLRRFEQEAQATAALNHPNIVSIFHVGQYDGSPYIVTELLVGETLRERLRKGPVRLREVLDLGVELARGLAAAHDAGIVHRDLKPENIWVTKDGRIKILDFGLAKLDPAKAASADGETVSVQQQTNPGHVLGTVGYMSPEQVRGQTADARSDIFAVGVILYEMLTGRPAFRKSTSAETMTAILNDDPPAVSQLAPAVPPGLQKVVNRCLAKNPAQRLQHASDLEFALESLSDSGTSSAPAVIQSQLPPWPLLAATAAIVAIGATFLAWWRTAPAVPVVEAVTQLTDDGEAKDGILVTDGARIYFNEGQTRSWRIAQVSVSGGSTAPLPTTLGNPQVVALSADGSSLLALADGMDSPTAPLWSISLPAGEPRRLADIVAGWADYFPDRRIVFSYRGELYIADKDGASPQKLFSGAAGTQGAWSPEVSPDGRRIAFTTHLGNELAIAEIASDGSGFRNLMRGVASALWTPDGKYLLYRTYPQRGNSDLWAIPAQPGIFHRLREPIQLTHGPLSYGTPTPSRDGKQIFAVGTKRRGELVRYDIKSQQFVPFLNGISAIDPTFSSDGVWVAYISYPDHTLWRSRADGTERKQLTYPPIEVVWPAISPDGTKVAFSTSRGEFYIISMEGGSPQKILDKDSAGTNWSPDSNLLLVGVVVHLPDRQNTWSQQVFDLRTGKLSAIPSSVGLGGGEWITSDSMVAATRDQKKFRVFDFNSQKWSDLIAGYFVNWNMSPDRKYFYFVTGGAEPKAQRLRFSDRQIETITTLKDLHRVEDSVEFGTQINVAPDGSPVFTRDIGSQEVYALTMKWP